MLIDEYSLSSRASNEMIVLKAALLILSGHNDQFVDQSIKVIMHTS